MFHLDYCIMQILFNKTLNRSKVIIDLEILFFSDDFYCEFRINSEYQFQEWKLKLKILLFIILSDWKKCQKFVNFWCSECQTEFRSFFKSKERRKKINSVFKTYFTTSVKREKLIQNSFFFLVFQMEIQFIVFTLWNWKSSRAHFERGSFRLVENIIFPFDIKIFKNGKLTEKTIVFTWSK